jgi:phosphatidylserine/phosphatidylglycerophosphate/cardiolipin synthase-like enzyme/Mg-chelatase subunit ChlD
MTTRVLFTGKVDHRYAWIGNDAEGSIDIFNELATVIGAATKSIAVSTMTFNYGTGAGATATDAKVENIAALLAQKAAAGIDVRIMANGGHRFQTGYFRALRGPVHLADNNLPALVHRITFQRSTTAALASFLIDSGAMFGPRGGGISYGWNQDVSADIEAHGTPDATFTSPLLGECYAHRNSDGPRTWSIELPPGYYYVFVVTGEAAFGSKSFVLAQGQSIFFRKNSSGMYQYFDHTNTGPGEFDCSTVDGGMDPESGLSLSRRLQVTSTGLLEIEVGKSGETGYSSVDYIEIYRASDVYPFGDRGIDKTRVQERALHHSKFVLIDEGIANQRLWTGSHNLTPVDPTASSVRSEDAVLTDVSGICAAFRSEFDQWWGAASGAPNVGVARNGVFKVPVIANGTMPSTLPGLTASWSVVFSPSKNGPGGVNLYQSLEDFLGTAATPSDDILLLIEQVTDGGTYTGPNGTFSGPTAIVNLLRSKALGGSIVRAMIGDSSPEESIFTAFSGIASAKVASLTQIHDKAAIVDVLRDNPMRARGKVLCGSMNWSQGAMHVNDEQTLIFHDPAIANQFLQRAVKASADAAIDLSQAADCVIVIDRSYSMNDPAAAGTTKIAAAHIAAKVFLDMLEHDGTHRLALVRFGSVVEPFSPPSTLASLTTTSASELASAIDGIDATLPIGASTCYGLALQKAFSLLTSSATSNPRRLVVFLTDGKENTAPMAATVYPMMATAGIEIHTTSFGTFSTDASGPNAILDEIARASGGTFAQVDNDTIHLQKRFAEVARDAMGMITILDPNWKLGPGEMFTQEFPVDMRNGALMIVLLWGGQEAGPEKVSITAPWGERIDTGSTGVDRRMGSGREVWRIDLDRLSTRVKHEVRGIWSVSARAPKGGLRVDLCVFASNTGIGHIVTDLSRIGNEFELRTRVFGGDHIAKDVRSRVVHALTGDKRMEKPSVIRLKKLQTRDPRFVGVEAARLNLSQPGVHEIRIAVEGQVPIKVEDNRALNETTTISVPFRRERVIRRFVPAKMEREEPKTAL